jgi:hypothetical protein
MTSDATTFGTRPIPIARALLYGTLAVGVLDLLDALVFFGLRGAQPVRVLQAIASGLLGRAAFGGGAAAALLGVILHFFIAFCVVAVYLAASRRIPALARHAFVFGPLYGLAVYAVMNGVVLPLSATTPVSGPRPLPVLVNGLLIHALGVGLPAALAARAAAPPSPRAPLPTKVAAA